MVASYSATIVGLSWLIISGGRNAWISPNVDFREGFTTVPLFAGQAVIVAWLTLMLGGRWRAEPGPIDAMGRAFGAGWIAMFLIRWMIQFFQFWF